MQTDRSGDGGGASLPGQAVRRWPLIAGFAIVGAAAALAYTAWLKPEYEAKTVLLMPFSGAQSPLASLRGDNSPIDYLAGIITSSEMQKRLADALDRTRPQITKGLSVEPSAKAQQITIRFRSSAPAQSMEGLQVLLRELGSISDTTSFSVAKQEAQALEQAVKDRERELLAAQRQLQTFYRKSTTAPSIDPGSPAVSPWVSRLKEAQYQLGIAEQKLDSTRQKLRAAGQSAQTVSVDLPALRDWRDKLDDLNYQLSVKQVDLGPKAAEVIRLTQQIAVARAALQSEVQKYLSQVDKSLSKELIDLEVQRLTLSWQVDFLRKMADAAPAEIISMEQLAIRVTSLRAAVADLRKAFEAKRVEAQVSSVTWSVLLNPESGSEPINKRYPYNAALGLVAGMMAGLAFTVILPSRRRPSA